MLKQSKCLFAAIAMIAVPVTVFGQSDFIGGGDGTTWEDASNWSAGIPVAVNADIEGGFAVSLTTNQTINELDLVGDQSTGVSSVDHSAGTLTAAGWAKIGGGLDGGGGDPTDGTYNLSGTAAVDGIAALFIGFRGGVGTVNLSDSASINVVGEGLRLAAEQPNSTGALTIADTASLTVQAFNAGGDTSTATVSQTGGTVTSNTWVALANFGGGGTATYDISAGSVTANDGNLAVGQEGTASLNVSGTAVVSQSTSGVSAISVGGVSDAGFIQDGTGTLSITGSSASVTGSDLHVAATAVSSGTLSWTADAGGVTPIVSGDNTDFLNLDAAGVLVAGTSTLLLDLTADSNSSVAGTEYLLVDNSAAVVGTFTGLAEGATVSIGGGNDGTLSYAGGTDGFDIVVTAVGGGGGLTGDFDGDGDVDCDDINAFSGNFGTVAGGAPANLDLTGDGNVDSADTDLHIGTLVVTMPNGVTGTFVGDVNCDGSVNVLGDAFALVAGLGTSTGAVYTDGDLNFDGAVNVLGDAFVLVANLGSSN